VNENKVNDLNKKYRSFGQEHRWVRQKKNSKDF
jgi:hypothetical protein